VDVYKGLMPWTKRVAFDCAGTSEAGVGW